MSSIKKMIGGEECDCFEFQSTGKMRLELNGTFADDIDRTSYLLVPLAMTEADLSTVSERWLSEQEKELGLTVGESCSSSAWWAGSLDSSHDSELTTKYDSLVYNVMAERVTIDVCEQFEKADITTAYGEPQAWITLDNGRSIEVTKEQEGLQEQDWFYSVRLNCSEIEYDNNEYHITNGVIDQYASSGLSLEGIEKLVSRALACNYKFPVSDFCKSISQNEKLSLDEMIKAAEARDAMHPNEKQTDKGPER